MFDQHPDNVRATPTRPFENAEWRVLGDGLEHRGTGYFIARDVIGMRRGDLWEWPLHLAEKTWCTPRSFREAFLAALAAFGIGSDPELGRSFVAGFGRVAGAGPKAEMEDFIALGDVVRPKSVDLAPIRKRGIAGEPRASVGRRAGMPTAIRVTDPIRQRAAN